MEQSEKRNFTDINIKDSMFYGVMRKLTLGIEINYTDKTYILSCAILFLREYKKNKKFTSYFEIAYFIILKYAVRYNDYEPLLDLSTNFGFYPVVKHIINNDLIDNIDINDVLLNKQLDLFKNNDYIETYEQFTQRNNLLCNKSNEVSYIAPTSYGKTSVILEILKNSNFKKIGIIVPTKSLLSQTYKLLRSNSLNKRIISHDEMYDGDEDFIAVFTQERALRLLINHNISFDILFIDEAHNLFDKSQRSVLLARLINKNFKLNANQKVIYLSPLIMDSANLHVRNDQLIQEQKINFNVKEPDIFEYRLDGKSYQYNRFMNDFYFKEKFTNKFEYIDINKEEKNFFYIRSPRKIETFCKKLNDKYDYIDSTLLNELSEVVANNLHKDFYCVDHIKKGIIYVHGKMPDLVKEFLEHKFKELKNLKHIVANTVILEGVNLPIDTIFILNTHSLEAKELTNLIGRANRLNQVFSPGQKGLAKLIPKIHFINSEYYNRSKSNMKNKIQLLRSRSFSDKLNNPTLLHFDFDKLQQQIDNTKNKDTKESLNKSLNEKIQIKNEELFINNEYSDEFNHIKKYLIESGIIKDYKNLDVIANNILTKKSKFKLSDENWATLSAVDKVFNIFINDIEDNIKNYEFKRLTNNSARFFYERHINNSHKYNLKDNIKSTIKYFEFKKNSVEGKEFYIGRAYGEISKSTVTHPNSNTNVYVNLTNKSTKEIVNLAIVKLKIEDDFVSFCLNKYITALYDFGLLNEEQYNISIYGSSDIRKSNLRKLGLSGGIISRLENDKQLENITVDRFNNITINDDFKRYKNSVDEFYQFELNKYL